MTAASLSTQKANNRTGLWIFLRLLGGWATVAALAYFLWIPNKDWGWLTLLFGWVLLTLLADEFAGWFGYFGLALGILPFFWKTPPEQWYVVFPLLAGALFALLIVKHSGGPFVLPFGAAIYAGAILGVGKLGEKLDPSLTLFNSPIFHRTALMAMAIGVGFSFLRQLISMIWRWYKARQARNIAKSVITTPAASTVVSSPEALAAETVKSASEITVVSAPAAASTSAAPAAALSTELDQTPTNPTIIDLEFEEKELPKKD